MGTHHRTAKNKFSKPERLISNGVEVNFNKGEVYEEIFY